MNKEPPLALCVLDAELRPTWLYPNLDAGDSGTPPLAQSLDALISHDGLISRARRVFATGCAERYPLTLPDPSGERCFDVTLAPMRGPTGATVNLTLCAIDRTSSTQLANPPDERAEAYRMVADYIDDWEYWLGADGCMRWVSPSCERVTGRHAADFLADPGLLESIIHPDDRLLMAEHLHRDHPYESLYFRILRQDGDIRWIEHRCQTVTGADGGYAGRRASNRDVTESRRVEQALRESETQLRMLFELATVGMVLIDPLPRRLLRVNERLCRLLGYDADELLGMSFYALTHPEDRERDQANYERAMASRDADYFTEKRYLRRDGQAVWVLANATFIRDEQGRPRLALAAIIDITDRRLAETQARDLAAVVECSTDFIGISALNGHGIYLNPAGQSLVGLESDLAVRAHRVQDYLFPDDLPCFHETVLPAVMTSGRWAGEFRFRHFRTGEPILIHWDVLRLDDPGTGRTRLATVARDIRRKKAAEQALLTADRRKDEFLAMLGHELRNPMAPIRNALDIVRTVGLGRDPRILWAVDVLDRQTAHMAHLLDDLLDVSRIVRGRLDLERRPVRIAEVVQQAVDGVRALMRARRHRLLWTASLSSVLVEGDPVRLSQILLNLLVNAANYTPEGGEVRVETELVTGGEATEVLIRVRDNGQGMAPERIEALFGLFSQGERPPDASSGGLGLGLAIARRLAELHGGRLDAFSAGPGQGTELRVYLPVLAQTFTTPSAAASANTPAQTIIGHAPRILVVDDNADVAEALAMLLELLGYAVETAASGLEALEIVERQCPRVALLDIGMPGMDGLELARRLRERVPEPERLWLVAVTGLGHEEARVRSLAAGFNEHLVKPLDRQTLLALLARLSQ